MTEQTFQIILPDIVPSIKNEYVVYIIPLTLLIKINTNDKKK